MTDKRNGWNTNGGKLSLQEGEMTVTDNHLIANIFNDYFSTIASNAGFNDITSARDAIIDHLNHQAYQRLRKNMRSKMMLFT